MSSQESVEKTENPDILEKMSYPCDNPSFAFAFSNDSSDFTKFAISTSHDLLTNQISLVGKTPIENTLERLVSFESKLTPTSIKFYPEQMENSTEMIAVAARNITIYSTVISPETRKSDLPKFIEFTDSSNSIGEYLTKIDWHKAHKNLLVSSSISGVGTVWDIEKRKIASQTIVHDREITDIAFSSSKFVSGGIVYMTSGFDGAIRMVDSRQKSPVSSLVHTENRRPIPSFSWEGNSDTLVAHSILGSSDISLFDIRKPSVEFSTLKGHTQEVMDLKFSPKFEETIGSVDNAGNVYIWDIKKKEKKIKNKEGEENDEEVLETEYTPKLSNVHEPKPNSIYWNNINENWIGLVTGETVDLVKI